MIDNCEGEKLNVYEQLKKYVDSYEELGIETNDQTADFFYILKDVVGTASYYTPSELADAEGVPELLKHLKSPAHWIGKKLTLYKFFSTRGGGQKRYLLDPVQIKSLVDLYFSEEKKEAQK